MRPLPDPNLSLRDASDFIFDSLLVRKAMENPSPQNFGVLLRDLIQEIYRLTQSCHLAEFTDHGLNHLCSLFDRVSLWSVPPTDSYSGPFVAHPSFSSNEASVLSLAILFHDVGMLSQKPIDLDPAQLALSGRSTKDVSNWVRKTHVARMKNLVHRLLKDTALFATLDHETVVRAFRVASAHEKWPWDWSEFDFSERDAGLAAVLAVVDLLDEDAMRCDSKTLLHHRSGSPLNVAHWIRHSLTEGRVLILDGIIDVELSRPKETDIRIGIIFDALRNHYRLVHLYADALSNLGANLISVNFTPTSGVPPNQSSGLGDWQSISQFSNQSALIYHLLCTFMPEALLDQRRLGSSVIERLERNGITGVNLDDFYEIRGTVPPVTDSERSFRALL